MKSFNSKNLTSKKLRKIRALENEITYANPKRVAVIASKIVRLKTRS